MNTNSHIRISNVDTDTMNCFTACFADTILKPLYDFANRRNLFGYSASLEIVSEWAKEFYAQYYAKFKDWDEFEESEENKYNAVSWDDFASFWVNDRFKKFKSGFPENYTSNESFANSSVPKIVIIIKNRTVSSVFSSIPVLYAKINCDIKEDYFIRTCESDSVAEDLHSIFESDDPVDADIIQQLNNLGF